MAGQTINVSILADTKKFSSAMRNLSKETGLDKLGAAFKRAGGRIVGFFKDGIKYGAAFGAVVAGLALKGGFTRALNIEDARAQLKGLGHDTKAIDQIMGNALASVKGTAFGLDEAGTIAAQAVAAGIKPGQDLERQLKLVGDSAALAKTDLGDMGSIFSKVWTSGRVGTEELNQIADRGIPIWAKLAESYGVSGTELRKMVSAGKVDAETFAEVMEETVGGSALAMGDTTRGAWRNMMAALSRAGASFLSGIFPKFKTGLTGITGFLDDIGPYAERAGKALGDWLSNEAIPAVQALIPKLKNLVTEVRDRVVPAAERLAEAWEDDVLPALKNVAEWIDQNQDKLKAIAVAVAAAVTAFMAFNKVTAIINAVRGAVLLLNAALLANPIGLVIAAVAALVAGLVYFFTQTETGQRIWEEVWPRIQAVAQGFADWFTGTFLPAAQNVWEAIKEVAGSVADWFQTHVGPVISAAVDLVIAVWERMQEAWESAWDKIQSVWDAIGAPVLAVIEGAWEHLKIVAEGAWNVIKTVIETVLGVIAGVIRTITAAIKGDWSGVWEEIKGIASTIWEGIQSVIATAIETLKRVLSNAWDTIKSTATLGWNAFKDTISDAWDRTVTAVRTKIDTVILWVKGLPRRAISALGDLSRTLWSAGWQLMQGFLRGIKGGWSTTKAYLGGLAKLIPLVKGPPSKDRVLLRNAGLLIMQGFRDGLEEGFGTVQRSLQTMTATVANTPFEPFDVATVGAGANTTPTMVQLSPNAEEALIAAARTAERPISLQVGSRQIAYANREGNHALGAPARWANTPQPFGSRT